MPKRFFLLTIISLSSCIMYAQTEESLSNKESNPSDSLSNQKDSHLLMFGLSYTTNNTNNKNFLDIKMPTVMADIYFFAKNGIWSSATYSNYIDASLNTYETELSIGYQKSFFEIVDIDFSYKWHQFTGDTLYSGIDYQHGLELSTGVDFDFIDFYIDNSILFGSTNNYFLDFSSSFKIEVNNLIFQSDNIFLAPTVIATFGTNDFIYLDIIPRYRRYKGRIIQLPPDIIENSESEFLYQSCSIMIPIMYTIRNISLTAAWTYSIPSNRLKEYGWSDQSSILFSLTYMPNIFK